MNGPHRRLACLCFLLYSTTAQKTSGVSQSPFDGTWKLDDDLTESTIHYDYVLREGTFRCTSCDPAVTVKADAHDHKAANPCYDTVNIRVIDDRTTEETDKKNGKAVGTLRMTVSADGNTAAEVWTERCNARGDIISGKDVMTRVARGPAGSHAISGSWKISKRVSRSDNALIITLKLTRESLSFSDLTLRGSAGRQRNAIPRRPRGNACLGEAP